MKKNLTKKLHLNKSTITTLNQIQLNEVRGKHITDPETEQMLCTATCTCGIETNCFCNDELQ